MDSAVVSGHQVKMLCLTQDQNISFVPLGMLRKFSKLFQIHLGPCFRQCWMLPAFCRRHDPDLGLHDPDLGCRCRDKTDDLALIVKVLEYGMGCMKVDVT